jgi:hypothetical protein
MFCLGVAMAFRLRVRACELLHAVLVLSLDKRQFFGHLKKPFFDGDLLHQSH